MLLNLHSIDFPGLDEQAPDSLEDELDLLPEYCHYRDEGCDLAPSCLECPFPECKDDRPHGRDKLTKRGRNAEIVKLHLVEKKSFQEIASQFHLTRRMVIKIIIANREKTQLSMPVSNPNDHS